MIVSTAANSGSVISEDSDVDDRVDHRRERSLSGEPTRIAPNTTPRIALITTTIRDITSSAPNVAHQRPLTS